MAGWDNGLPWPGGKEQMFYAFGPGEPFGLTPLFHNQKFPACATSMVSTTVLFFPKEEFLQLTADHPPLALVHALRAVAAIVSARCKNRKPYSSRNTASSFRPSDLSCRTTGENRPSAP
ncbi:MAG: Crp/Fnr family transcriptional regulator [Candidatus Electrothrix sp. LOE2]|nr:Crp/Fnr family transcriptional regulator [Candidatus Electrothrix sp. LOE2]